MPLKHQALGAFVTGCSRLFHARAQILQTCRGFLDARSDRHAVPLVGLFGFVVQRVRIGGILEGRIFSELALSR